MLIIALILMILGRKITLKNRILISQTMNSNSLQGLIRLTRKILKYTFSFEIIGALFIAIDFVPIYGFKLGLFKALFQSVSAFCNAGFDLIGNQSMIPFVTHKAINITCMLLTTIGGLGFLVWDNVSNCIKEGIKEKTGIIKIIKKFSLHTKLVLIMQIVLVFIGATAFLGFEYNNPETIANYNLQDKILISTFQSVSARTAGFATVNLANAKDITKVILSVLMLIGAGSGSMAGGIKTTTLLVVILGIYTHVIGKKNISVLKRTISDGTFIKAVSVVMISLFLLFIANMVFIINSDIYVLDMLFESISAIATVGLTSGALANMNLVCLWVVILLMYVGRIGTITMALSFVIRKPKENDLIVYAKEDVIVG